MTTKQQQQHVSRFLEASLLRQAEGKLKNKKISIVKRGKNACTRSRIRIAHNHHDTHKKHNLTKNAVVKFFKKESLWSLLVLDWYTVVQISFAVATFYIQLQKWPFLKELGNHQLKVWSKTILKHEKYGLENQGLEVYNFWIARGKWEWLNLCCH